MSGSLTTVIQALQERAEQTPELLQQALADGAALKAQLDASSVAAREAAVKLEAQTTTLSTSHARVSRRLGAEEKRVTARLKAAGKDLDAMRKMADQQSRDLDKDHKECQQVAREYAGGLSSFARMVKDDLNLHQTEVQKGFASVKVARENLDKEYKKVSDEFTALAAAVKASKKKTNEAVGLFQGALEQAATALSQANDTFAKAAQAATDKLSKGVSDVSTSKVQPTVTTRATKYVQAVGSLQKAAVNSLGNVKTALQTHDTVAQVAHDTLDRKYKVHKYNVLSVSPVTANETSDRVRRLEEARKVLGIGEHGEPPDNRGLLEKFAGLPGHIWGGITSAARWTWDRIVENHKIVIGAIVLVTAVAVTAVLCPPVGAFLASTAGAAWGGVTAAGGMAWGGISTAGGALASTFGGTAGLSSVAMAGKAGADAGVFVSIAFNGKVSWDLVAGGLSAAAIAAPAIWHLSNLQKGEPVTPPPTEEKSKIIERGEDGPLEIKPPRPISEKTQKEAEQWRMDADSAAAKDDPFQIATNRIGSGGNNFGGHSSKKPEASGEFKWEMVELSGKCIVCQHGLPLICSTCAATGWHVKPGSSEITQWPDIDPKTGDSKRSFKPVAPVDGGSYKIAPGDTMKSITRRKQAAATPNLPGPAEVGIQPKQHPPAAPTSPPNAHKPQTPTHTPPTAAQKAQSQELLNLLNDNQKTGSRWAGTPLQKLSDFGEAIQGNEAFQAGIEAAKKFAKEETGSAIPGWELKVAAAAAKAGVKVGVRLLPGIGWAMDIKEASTGYYYLYNAATGNWDAIPADDTLENMYNNAVNAAGRERKIEHPKSFPG